jgi:hypothetical protein
MTLYAPYVPSLSENLPRLLFAMLTSYLLSADDRMGIEESVARDYSARRSRRGSFLS